jgi:transcriptional regulator with XRE-family HTH domain
MTEGPIREPRPFDPCRFASPPVHVLRTLRKLYGLSQQKLATQVGCSLPAIKQIETGRLRPSAGLAHRIFMQTGLNPEQLMNNEFPETPSHPDGQPLSKDMLRALQLRLDRGGRSRAPNANGTRG